ncbi:MAG TPA: allophanate hydrolase subunit 1 [Pedococcus sp.]|jgi:KipI family sensor histidine kinase inhibitor|uniref:5-oxoprolinase subunit B family protein n=1 Tax=Pedococcus sp. TaxID=2860345 RepID=UPI002F95122B
MAAHDLPDRSGRPDTAPALLPCGESAFLVELGDIPEVLALHSALESQRPHLPGLADLVPAASTLLVVAEESAALGALRQAVSELLSNPASWPVAPATSPSGGVSTGESTAAVELRIAVRYDGEDLEDVAHHTGLTVAEVVEAHTGALWTAAFAGFAPGFAYLAGGDPRLEVPRRSEPRTRVPAGAVGLAGRFSGIYPRSSPGGWRIIGHTEAVLWDLDRDPPALLRPGTRVRFVAAEGGHVGGAGS